MTKSLNICRYLRNHNYKTNNSNQHVALLSGTVQNSTILFMLDAILSHCSISIRHIICHNLLHAKLKHRNHILLHCEVILPLVSLLGKLPLCWSSWIRMESQASVTGKQLLPLHLFLSGTCETLKNLFKGLSFRPHFPALPDGLQLVDPGGGGTKQELPGFWHLCLRTQFLPLLHSARGGRRQEEFQDY